jgi:drug/metabolite transporter (DMT)-like permease
LLSALRQQRLTDHHDAYRLIRGGNLVNVTSLFYLVPIVTALLDYVLLGHTLAIASVLGMAGILSGLALVFAQPRSSRTQ